MNGKRRHPTARVGEQCGLVGEDRLGGEGFDASRFLVAPLDERDPGEDLPLLEHDRHDVVDHRRPTVFDDGLVVDGGTRLLAEPDHRHLRQSALDRAREHRVGLDPIDEHHVVGLARDSIEQHREAELGFAEGDRVHARHDRAATGRLGDAVRLEQLDLPLGRSPAVAPHRGHDERLGSERAQMRDGRGDRRRDVGDAPTSGGDRHAIAGPHLLAEIERRQRLGHPRRDVIDLGAADRLAHQEERR